MRYRKARALFTRRTAFRRRFASAGSNERGLKVIDATCPLVTKVHVEAIKFAKQGYSLVLVGHRDHEEVEGTQGEAPNVDAGRLNRSS